MSKENIYTYYTREGNKKTLVCVAGSGEGQFRWEPYIEMFLAAGFNVLLFDNPGVGVAEFRAEFTVEGLAEEYMAIVRQLGIKEFALLGHSFGSFIAQRIAMDLAGTGQQSMITGLALISSSSGSMANQRQILDYQTHFIQRGAHKSLFKAGWPEQNQEWFDVHLGKRLSLSLDVIYSFMLASSRWSSIGELHKIEIPTLVVHGYEDQIIEFHQAKQLAGMIQNSVLLAVDAGHYPYIEDTMCMAKILEFLAQSGSTAEERAAAFECYPVDKGAHVGEDTLSADKTFRLIVSDEEYAPKFRGVMERFQNPDEKFEAYNQLFLTK